MRNLVEGELGTTLEKTYANFDAEPFESRLMSQVHRARLRNHQRVVVEIIHPEVVACLETDTALLDLVPDSLGRDEWSDVRLEDALVDFRRTFPQRTNLECQAEALQSLSTRAGASEGLGAPRAYGNLSTSMVLTRNRLPGSRLSDLFLDLDESAIDEAIRDREEVALTLVMTWLIQALDGRPFPVEARPGNVVTRSDQRISFTGGLVTGLDGDLKTNVWDYLIATAEQNPDRACALLVREMEREPQSASEGDMRIRFRQIVPFRDGGWSREGDSDSLAEHLFLQWRTMRDHGYRIRPDVLGFFRGLFCVAALARRLAPDRDVLREGLMELRQDQSLARLRQRVAPLQWNDLMQNASTMITLPHQLDQALARAAKSDTPQPGPASRSRSQRKNGTAAMIALLFLAGMVVIWTHYLTGASAVPKEWIDGGSAMLFVLLGGLLLRVATSR